MSIVSSVTRGGKRHYYRESAPEIRHPGVTSIIDTLGKPFLQRWAANMAADLALDSIEYLQHMVDRDREGAKRYVAGAAKRYTDQRSAIGTKAHDLFERLARGQDVKRVHLDMEPYRRQFMNFLTTVKPELIRAEDVAWSDTHAYAGSFDAWLRLCVVPQADGTWRLDPYGIRPDSIDVNVIGDWKTSRSIWPSVALQMGAYAHADLIISPDGEESPMPAFDGAVVLHITPEGWTLVPVYLPKLKQAFGYFLTLREAYDWDHSVAKTVLGKPLAASGDSFVTGTERRG